MSDVTVVRGATDADAASIGNVHAAAWAAAYGDVFDAAFLERAVEGRRAGWAFALPRILTGSELVLVAERADDIVAFAHAGAVHDGPPMAEIFAFYVHPSAWGTGTASELMTAACSQLATAWDEVILWTLDRTGRARHFYEKSGFTEIGSRRVQTFTDWSSNDGVDRPVVEYARPL